MGVSVTPRVEAHRHAVAAGGTLITEVTHLFFGDRVGRVRDPLGNLYWIQNRVEDLSPQEMEVVHGPSASRAEDAGVKATSVRPTAARVRTGDAES